MKILFISKYADAMGVAIRLRFEGHDVALWAQKDPARRMGKGLIRRPEAWRPMLPWADLIIVDYVGYGHLEDVFRKFGKPYLCCNSMMDMIELDRAKGIELFKKVGMTLPETFSYGNIKEAEKGLQELEFGNGFVLKPDGNIASEATMVVKEEEILPWALGKYKPGTSLVVQRVVDGVEVSTEGWFNGRDFLTPFNHTFEEKRFMNDDLGPNTGCSGNVVVRAPANKLTGATVERLKPFLTKIGYRGPCDINCIVNAEGAYVLEATARLGYDACEALFAGLREPLVDLLFETATGTKKTMALGSDPSIAVRLTVLPYPLEDVKPKEESVGSPILGINKENLKSLWLCDVFQDKKDDGLFKFAGYSGLVLKATATGQNVREASRRAYRTLKNIKVSGKQYRTDIGKRVEGDLAKLKEWGWI